MITKYALFKVFEALRNSSEAESVRSLARKAKVGVATSKRCLDYLLSKRLVEKKVLARLYQYSLNEDNILTRQLKVTMSISELENSGLAGEIREIYPQTLSITLFGSVATGHDNPKSDVDILLITRKEVKMRPLNAEKRLKRELSIVNYSHNGWKKADKAFYEGVIVDGLQLFGEVPAVR
ncbi:MAG: nucleotidyltransferase domain-containing protein [Nanoarchaeota archaeon]|nr:nucleotidyltransferase domain-containing protein [Nanoarchaeota archaeon]